MSTSNQAWSDLQARYDRLMPNPLVRHTAEVAYNQSHPHNRWLHLNPTIQRFWYETTEAVMKALGKL